jgi:hypothetical protein
MHTPQEIPPTAPPPKDIPPDEYNPIQDPPLNPTEPDIPDPDPAEPPLKMAAADVSNQSRKATMVAGISPGSQEEQLWLPALSIPTSCRLRIVN